MWFLARSRSNTFDAWPSCLLAPGPGYLAFRALCFSFGLGPGLFFFVPFCFQSLMAFGAALVLEPFVFVPLWLQEYPGF